MGQKTTIQIEKSTRIDLKKVGLDMGDKTMEETIKELIILYENRETN